MSDGLSTDRHMAVVKAREIRSLGIHIYIYGVDRESDHSEFLDLASNNSFDVPGIYSTQNNDLLNTLYMETVNSQCGSKNLMFVIQSARGINSTKKRRGIERIPKIKKKKAMHFLKYLLSFLLEYFL